MTTSEELAQNAAALEELAAAEKQSQAPPAPTMSEAVAVLADALGMPLQSPGVQLMLAAGRELSAARAAVHDDDVRRGERVRLAAFLREHRQQLDPNGEGVPIDTLVTLLELTT